MRTIKDQQGKEYDVSTLRSGKILFTEDVAQGYDFKKGCIKKLKYRADIGVYINFDDTMRLDNGEITQDVLKTLIYIP